MFGQRLKAARLYRGLNQTELGNILDPKVQQQQIDKWESQRNLPNVETGGKLAQALNVSADYLLGLVSGFHERVEDEELSPEERHVIWAMRRGDKVDAIKVIVGG